MSADIEWVRDGMNRVGSHTLAERHAYLMGYWDALRDAGGIEHQLRAQILELARQINRVDGARSEPRANARLDGVLGLSCAGVAVPHRHTSAPNETSRDG